MTPSARLAAAIAVLDRILRGEAAEQALTNWARASRFAGSGDRSAVRDHVFDALRRRRSYAALGGGDHGRGLILGSLRAQGLDPAVHFTGAGHAPAALSGEDTGRTPQGAEALDVPDWLMPRLLDSLGDQTGPVLLALRERAPVFLRVNLMRSPLAGAEARLAAEGISATRVPHVKSALEVTGNARKIQTSACYLSGLVELQDAASQAVVEALPLTDGQRVLDFCAGGGGKALAMAARARVSLFAHDAELRRMRDIPERAKRAGVKIEILENPETKGPYDLVLTDVPCSGSGSWRRDPQGKWALTEPRLDALAGLQSAILQRAAALVAPRGTLAYATCSLLREENETQIAAFLARNPAWSCTQMQRFSPLQGGDGFFVALLTRVC